MAGKPKQGSKNNPGNRVVSAPVKRERVMVVSPTGKRRMVDAEDVK